MILSFSKEQHITPLVVDLAGKTIERISVSQCSGLHFINGNITPAVVKEQVLVYQSQDISFDNVGLTANDGLAFGFRLADSTDVTVSNCRIDRAFQGINAGRIKGLKILNNYILGFSNDAIVICNDEDVMIDGNTVTGSLRLDGRHPDGVQMISKDGLINRRIVVQNNVIVGPFQGIFGGTVDDLLVKSNFVRVDHGNGIGLNDATTNVRLIDNRVGTLPGSINLANINVKPASIVERHGNVREAWGRFGELRD